MDKAQLFNEEHERIGRMVVHPPVSIFDVYRKNFHTDQYNDGYQCTRVVIGDEYHVRVKFEFQRYDRRALLEALQAFSQLSENA